jgi:hypothetical protein
VFSTKWPPIRNCGRNTLVCGADAHCACDFSSGPIFSSVWTTAEYPLKTFQTPAGPLPSDVHQSVQTHARLRAFAVHSPQWADDGGRLRIEEFKIADVAAADRAVSAV